ncbi:MAG TPA: purine-nucleoside phosphorylase [Candidatus Acidoferrum sp.]
MTATRSLKAAQTKSKASAEFVRAERAAKFILSKTKLRPRIALVLGSGLGDFADEFTNATKIPYAKIPNFPQSTAIGHAGRLVIGNVGDIPVAGMQGRVHLYEGYSVKEVAFPIRVFARMGIKAVILTNAAGGINRNYSQGCLVAIRDHVNLQGVNPLAGPNDERFGLRFPDMTQSYDREFQRFVTEEGKKLALTIHNGVYLAVQGPSYETPAEIYSFRTIGADLVGMSTVPEVIAARHCGIRVLGISCVTNMAAGTTDAPLNQEEVLEIAGRIKPQFIAVLRAVIPRISEAIA